jgi:hypothetical protein
MTELPLPWLEEMLGSVAANDTVGLLCYTSFGVVRGSFTAAATPNASSTVGRMIELHDAVVEHYSNHLPTGKFDKLYLSLTDIAGCALIRD